MNLLNHRPRNKNPKINHKIVQNIIREIKFIISILTKSQSFWSAAREDVPFGKLLKPQALLAIEFYINNTIGQYNIKLNII